MLDPGHFEDLLDNLERDVLAIDRTGDTGIVHLLFRTIHNLKSSSAQAGLSALAGDLHSLEDTMDRVRRGKVPWTPACYDQVTRVIDQVRLAIQSENLGADPLPPAEPAAVEPAPEAAMAPAPVPEAPAPGAGRWGRGFSQEAIAACQLAEAVGLGVYRIEKLFSKGLDEDTFLSLPVLEDIRELGKLIAFHPSWQAYSEGPEEQVVSFLFTSPRTETELACILFDPLLVLAEPRTGQPARRKERLRILIIEDDQTTAHLMQYILRQHGEVVVCATAMEGLACFHEALDGGDRFDMVLLDLVLPDLHGDGVLMEIREHEFRLGILDAGARCQVIISTANGNVDQIMLSLQHDPDGYLIKPVNFDLIIEKVADLKAQRLVAPEPDRP